MIFFQHFFRKNFDFFTPIAGKVFLRSTQTSSSIPFGSEWFEEVSGWHNIWWYEG